MPLYAALFRVRSVSSRPGLKLASRTVVGDEAASRIQPNHPVDDDRMGDEEDVLQQQPDHHDADDQHQRGERAARRMMVNDRLETLVAGQRRFLGLEA